MPLGAITFKAAAQGNNVALEVLCDGMTHVVQMTRVREGSPEETIVRGTVDVVATGPDIWRGNDWEAPARVPITYTVDIIDEGDSAQASATVVMTGEVDYGGDYLAPIGRPELGQNVIVEYGGVGAFTTTPLRDVVPVLNRKDPVVVSFGRSSREGVVTFLTLDDAAARGLTEIMQFAAVMFVATPDFGFTDPLFFSPGNVTYERTTGLGSEPSRRWFIDMLEVARPPANYGTDLPSQSWQELVDASTFWQGLTSELWYDVAGFGLA